MLPTLYKQTTTGKIQQWSVKVSGSNVISEYGQIDGKLQETTDVIKAGKNLGKVNETTTEEQALLKAQQLFDKKVKEGYVADVFLAQENKNNLEGVEPMLAFAIEKKEKYVVFPAFAQPKLDGFRCIAVISNGKAELFTRTQKRINTLPHIVKELEETYASYDFIIIDGELYNHDLKDEFEKICSTIKRDDIHPDHELVQYHIYDCVMESIFEDRFAHVTSPLGTQKFLKKVETSKVCEEEDLTRLFRYWLSEGYEGAMYRAPNMNYEKKRSPQLLKVKVMDDAEFQVFGVEEGTGKLMGQAGAVWVRELETGIEFKAKMKSLHNPDGKRIESKDDYQARCTDWFENIENYKGKIVTVQFQGKSKYGVPRFPILLRIREDI